MATTRLDNETLRAELQKTQDALEAALRECQDKDCKYSQLLTTLRCHKVDHSRVVESLVIAGKFATGSALQIKTKMGMRKTKKRIEHNEFRGARCAQLHSLKIHVT